MKSNYWIIGIVIALAILIAFLLWPDKQHDTHKSDHAEVKADNDTLKAHGVDYKRIADSLTKANMRLDSANKSLVKGQAVTENKLNAKTAEVRTLVAQIREINQDTGYFGHLLDSLEEQVKSLQFLIIQYEQYADSINTANAVLYANNASLIEHKNTRIAELQGAYDKLYKEYVALFETTKDLQKDLRRQKLKTKVAGVLGGALAIISLLK